MYAVIKTGGKQERVEVGQRLDVERLCAAVGDEVSVAPVLVVDGTSVLAGPEALAGARVAARVVGEAKGAKIRGFTYKPKTNNRRRFGHRQHYHTIEITAIESSLGGAEVPSATIPSDTPEPGDGPRSLEEA